jgi:hypothetical protein
MLISAPVAAGQPAVGVKPGYWVEYSVKTTGTPPAAQDINWAKIQILDVDGEQFHANFTVRYVYGTLSSSVRTFDFSVGNVETWIIIPANLDPGQSFYDSLSNSNVTIQGQMTKEVAGAALTVTYVNLTITDIQRHKEWDKATGFYIQSVDFLSNYTVNAKATATNIWSPQILGLNQTVFYSVVVIVIVALALLVSALFFAWKRKKPSSPSSVAGQTVSG